MALDRDTCALLGLDGAARRLGSGAFGRVHVAEVGGVRVAIKEARTDVDGACRNLRYEARVLRELNGRGCAGVPSLLGVASRGAGVFLTLSHVGTDLSRLVLARGRLRRRAVWAIARATLARLRGVHEAGYVHRDVKPHNICVDDARHVHLIDFGLAKKYVDRGHIEFQSSRPFLGTQRYASINAHLGVQHSRRDDLMSLGYTLLWALRGRLPWQDMGTGRDDRLEVCRLKCHLSYGDDEAPVRGLVEHARSLGFAEAPDYAAVSASFGK